MNPSLYLIAGLGKTGQSIARYLKRRGLPFAVFDTRAEVAGLTEFKADFPEVEIFLEHLPPALYASIKTIIASPGVALSSPVLAKAKDLQVPIIGDIECLVREISAPIIAITGTNGKSTVTTLVGEMAKAQGFVTAVAGNIGTPVLDLLDDGQTYDVWVLELSSFQLDLLHSLSAEAATILNVSEDHLDRHASFAEYIAAKQGIYRNAKTLIVNREDPNTLPGMGLSQAVSISFGLDAPASPEDWGIVEQSGRLCLAQGNEAFMPVDELRIKGQQNWQNALAACALASALKIEKSAMRQVLESFSGLPHRCQWVRTLDTIDWINDSKGTNIGAAIAAISGIGKSMAGKIVLIAGGLGKGADFKALKAVVGLYVRRVILIGQDAALIEEALSNIVPIQRAASLEDAVQKARAGALRGDVVLLSPACASFDMFQDFNHRGEVFKELVDAL